MTYRGMEAVIYHKNLITDNWFAKEYDFYAPERWLDVMLFGGECRMLRDREDTLKMQEGLQRRGWK